MLPPLQEVSGDENLMTVIFDMKDYFQSACEIFMNETRETLKAGPTPLAPELRAEDLDALMQTPGKYRE